MLTDREWSGWTRTDATLCHTLPRPPVQAPLPQGLHEPLSIYIGICVDLPSSKPTLCAHCHTRMSVLVLKNTTVELTTGDDCFLTDIVHLILEITHGQVVDVVDLWSQGSNRGVWDADSILVLHNVTVTFTVSVFMQVDEDDCQLLGSVELYG
ncbi:hypothetical protein CPB86DRAFT_297701 [Serendipita vermifera]|nr:hypothetical protein CPB86DRAFT_297701 [Serendipita vermifera]